MSADRGTPVRYGAQLRAQFPGLNPVVDDLLLLEAHQVAALPQRAPLRELAVVLHAHPTLVRYFVARSPEVETFVTRLLADHPPGASEALATCEQALVWELADWIVYQRAPEEYDSRSGVDFELAAITDVVALDGTVVLDAGAGTGRVALAVAPVAHVVFAVEPVATLRSFIREKAAAQDFDNVFVIDGFLRAIPLPRDTVDVLLTCQAIGWSLSDELREIERVVRPGGVAQHLFGAPTATANDPLFEALAAGGYESSVYRRGDTVVRSYWKHVGD